MNVLSFEYEIVKTSEGLDWYTFYYCVDGKRLIFEYWDPITCYQINGIDFYSEVYLGVCDCGYEDCGSCIADVSVENNIVTWKVHDLWEEEIKAIYQFSDINYKEVVGKISELAWKAREILDSNK